MAERLNVLVQSSDYYAPFCGVTLQSLFQNNEDINEIKVFLISDKIGEDNLQKFRELAQNFKRELSIIDGSSIDVRLVNYKVPKYHGSYTAYYKMFALDLIQDNIERILYLDSDTLVDGSLKELISFDMHGCVSAMALDLCSEWYRKKVGHSVINCYNTGVILFDLCKWREERCEQRIVDHLTKVCSKYLLADLDILNIIIGKQTIKLDFKYHITSDCLTFKKIKSLKIAFGVKNYYSEEEFEQARSKPVIYHFCAAATVSRPWFLGSRNPIVKKWDRYLLNSIWKDYQKEKERGSFPYKIQRILFRLFPEEIFAIINVLCTSIIIQIKCLKIQSLAEK